MNVTKLRLRRLILGMSVEDAQSKFDSPQSRLLLRVAHERHNQGILHELQVAQQQRNRMPSEKKCHISRYTKPSVKGFQGYLKQTPDDFIVVELWENLKSSSGNGGGSSGQPQTALDSDAEDGQTALDPSDDRASARADTGASPSAVVSSKIAEEKVAFSTSKETVLETLRDVLDNVKSNVLVELASRRQSGALIAGNQPSVIERLVGEVNESNERGYKTLSSSTHLLEPVEVEQILFTKKDKEVADAFKSGLLSFPAREGDISYSLWVAGGLIADDEAAVEFPYHIAKYVVSDDAERSSHNRLPRVNVEVYFSPELYQLQYTIGKPGITALRKFIGSAMMRQHEPMPLSSSLLLNASAADKELLNLYSPSTSEAIRIPWIRKSRSLVSTLTGIALNVEDAVEENATIEKMKESVGYVWRTWGHLIKDLHVHGDLDYLYVSIDRQKELKENDEYIAEVRTLEQEADQSNRGCNLLALTNGSGAALASPLPPSHGDSVRKRGQAVRTKESYFCPLPADFTVVECLLERKGLPHNMVMEDITDTLTDMQTQSLEMMRLAVIEEAEANGGGARGAKVVVPVLYAPKVTISHAGVIENGTHSFQRIRIRGSTLAHVEALIAALSDGGGHFTSREDSGLAVSSRATPSSCSSQLSLPKNLTFSATREPQTALLLRQSRHNVGEQAASGSVSEHREADGRFRRRQSHQALDFMVVSEEEREFWKEHYYRLSEPKVLFQDRVDPSDLGLGAGAGKPKKPSPRLLEHLSVIGGKLTAGGADDVREWPDTDKEKKAKRRDKKKPVDVAQIPGEKMFQYLCTDMEAETSQYDLRVGDCPGYAYKVNVQRIPDKQTSHVLPAVRSVCNKGFVNYFGPNRFATYTKMNIHPGLHLLKGEFRAAAHAIVQQFYADAAVEAEKKRTGLAFPQPLGFEGRGGRFHLNDFARRGGGRRSIAEHGTAMQRVLSNALQATLLLSNLNGDVDAALEGAGGGLSSLLSPVTPRPNHGLAGPPPPSFAEMINVDPCADAFLNVIGPNACHILIHEFLAFVWNDIVNQRLQRYGTFAILPGDLVRRHPHAPRGSKAYGELTRVTRRDIQRGQRTHWDVVLPIPGANIELPDNHTADLYVVTLKRMGLSFNAEARQWECFYPRLWQQQQQPSPSLAKQMPNGSHPNAAAAGGGGGGGVPLASPYRLLSTSYQLMEEELGFHTPFTEPLPRHLSSSGAKASDAHAKEEVLFDPEADSLTSALTGNSRVGGTSVFDAAGLRPDLQRQSGNPLNLLVEAGYRQPLFCPKECLRWQFSQGAVGDPRLRWGVRHLQETGKQQPTPLPGSAPLSSSSSSSSSAAAAALPVGSYIPGDGVHSSPELVLPSQYDQHREQQQRHQHRMLPTPFPLLPRPVQAAPPTAPSRWRERRLPIPKVPYWLLQHNDACLTLDFQLPTGVYPSMLLRELTKLDVNSPEVVDIDRQPSSSITAAARAEGSLWSSLPTDQQELYRKYLTRRRQRAFVRERPQAVSLALLHQQIFRSGGIRGSLIPTLRSYDSVSK